LPKSAEENKVEASYENGVLHIEIAKKVTEQEKSAKKIEVK
jgi:HSP20 family molecular chaperone IbpA